MIGTTVSHYKILEKIGEGGMGEVYLAEDTKLRRQVTLKFLAEKLTADEERKQRFVQEARAAAAVEHPHIAAIYDVDEAEGRTFIAMEYVRGESLRDAIQGKKLSVRKSIELAIQVADGLSTAHQRGVVHRDLKPENVLLSEQGYAKIIDFGLAKLVEPLFSTEEDSGSETPTQLKTREGVVMGTVAYMSPEQARGGAIDARSDIFSFGVLLNEMLSGESPFRRGTPIETLNAILKEPAPSVTIQGTTVPQDLDRVLRKTLQKDPEQRYQTMKDVANDLRELREEMTTASRPAVVVMGSAKSRWATVAVVALAGLVAGWFFFGRDRTPPGIGASGRPSVAVMYFESMSGDEEIRWLSKGLPNMLVTDLAQTPGLDVVSSQRIHEILKRIGHDDLDSIDKSVVAEVARKAGAGAVVVGSIFKSGDEIRIDVQVEDVASGRVLSADSVRGYDVFPLVDELTARIRTSLHIGDQPSARPIAEVTTPSLEAFQLYTEGYDTLLNVRYGHARTLLEEAVKIDPSFAMAHIALSFLAERRGDMAGSRDYVNKAFENLDRLPERQQLMVRARYAETTEDVPEKSVELYETLIARYPDEELAYMNLSFLYHDLGRPEDAVAAVERGVKAVPQSGPLYNAYGYQLLDVGRYPEAIRALETYARLNPEEPNPHDSLAEAFLITGQPAKALENYARSREVDPSFLASHVGSAFAFAVLGRYDEFFDDVAKLQEFSDQIGWPPAAYHFMKSFGLSRVGRYQDAAAELKEGLDVAGRAEDAGRQGALELLSALYALEQRNYRETLESVGRAEALLPHVESDWVGPLTVAGSLLAGTAEARSGNLEAARDRLDSQRDVMDSESQSEQWWRAALEGEVALAAADLAAAEVAFLAGEPEIKMTFSLGTSIIGTAMANSLPFHDGLARVRKAQGDLDGAIEIYRDLLTPDIGSKWVAWLEPRYVLRLARLFDETGDKEGARAEYERFLELWKDADEGLPEFKEARKYLGT